MGLFFAYFIILQAKSFSLSNIYDNTRQDNGQNVKERVRGFEKNPYYNAEDYHQEV